MNEVEREGSQLAATVAAGAGAHAERELREPTEPELDTPDSGPASDVDAIDLALQAEETARLRTFSRIVMLMVVLVSVQLPWLGGSPSVRTTAAGGLGGMFLLAAWGYLHSSRRVITPQRVMRILGWGLATLLLPLEYCAGFFSPMTVVLCLGIYHMAQSADRPQAGLAPLYVIVTWTLGALFTSFGVLPDEGLIRAAALSGPSRVFMIVGVASTLLAALWLSRKARSSVRQAMFDANRALLAAQKREAVLQEAQHQLDHAIRMVVGKPGRHTGALAGTWRLGDVIGLGAMSEVYEARGAAGESLAAVKLLHDEMLRRDDQVARFLREAELCTRFDHPNIVKAHGFGRLDGGAPFMAMERLVGSTLSEVLRQRGQLPLAEVLELGDAVAAGLQHAHQKGVIHRDLKPSNLLAAQDAGSRGSLRWTILDFGISKPLDSTGTLTGTTGVLGTPSYMSPEQARGLPLDARSDLFSLASVLYRALTGRPAFPGIETPAIMFDVVYGMPEQPSQQVEGLLPDIDLTFAIALAKDRRQRFQKPAELMTALREAAKGTLPEPLRARGRAMLAARPWGSRPEAERA